MATIKLVHALAGLAGAAALMAGAAAAAESVDNGRVLIQRNCGGCHAVGTSDTSPTPSAPAFRDLGLRYPVDDIAEALAEGILTGHPQMPEFRFEPEQVNDIITYLKSIQTEHGASLSRPGT